MRLRVEPATVSGEELTGGASGRARSARARRGEWALHVVAMTLVAWTAWRSAHPASRRATTVDQSELRPLLTKWTMGSAPATVHARFSTVPDATTRSWLGTMTRTGTAVTWEASAGARLPATAIDVEPAADPAGVLRVGVAAPAASRVALGDRLGLIDTVHVPRGMAVMRVPPPVVGLTAAVGGTVARAGAVDSVVFKRIYVVASAGWEGKFIVRALEEDGWGVDAHLLVAPKNDVVPGQPVVLDTAHYAAVIAVDSAAAPEAGRIARYVEMGGGLVVGPGAVGALRSVTPGSLGAEVHSAVSLDERAPLAGLTLAPVANLGTDAVVLASRGALTTVAARRVGTNGGRVVQIGYADTWRWRMAAGDSGAAAYRAWWVALVSTVAYAPGIARPPMTMGDPAPYAATVAQFGAPATAGPVGHSRSLALPAVLAFAIIVVALIMEWASRRLRGAR